MGEDYEHEPYGTPRTRHSPVEPVIRVMAPFLDLVLFAGERLSKVAGRNDLPPAPPQRSLDERVRP